MNQQIALKTIRKLGFPVRAVWNGKEALDYLQNPSADQPRPEIILMDVQMPIMDGYRATYTIRNTFAEDPALRGTPIVAMTASAIQGDREKCQTAGMDDYLAKPVKKVNLEKMLVKWALEGKKKRAKLVEAALGKHHRPSNTRTKSNFTDDAQTPQEQLASEVDRLSFARYRIEHSSESAGERALRHQQNEEKAISLRDDALLESGDDPRNHLGRGLSDGSREHHDAEPNLSNALTMENMHELESTFEKDDPLKRFQREDSGGMDSSMAATVGESVAPDNGGTPSTPRLLGPSPPVGNSRRPG